MSEIFYQDDLVTLYHGTCVPLSAHPELPLITEWLAADVLVTDPPYGIGWVRHGISHGYKGRIAPDPIGQDGIAGDDSTDARDAALRQWGKRRAFIFGSLMQPIPAETRQVAIYGKPKNAGTMVAVSGVRRDVEAIYLVGDHPRSGAGRSAIFKTRARTVSNSHVGLVQRYGHPHAKPLDVLQELIMLTPAESSIADPFAGSGSTLVAAKMLGRKAIGVEIEEKYCEIAAQRLLQDALPFEVTA